MAMDGDTNFSEWQKNIKDALENIKTPIIIKETENVNHKQNIQNGNAYYYV